MCCLRQLFAGLRGRFAQSGYTLMETSIALGVALISVMAAFGLTLAIERHYRGYGAAANVYSDSRIAIERMFREISETSNSKIVIQDEAISFASARNESGEFILKPHSGILKSDRPDWQKAVVYYALEDGDSIYKKLYRKEIPKTNWASNYNPTPAIDNNGEVIARNLQYVYFDYYPADSLAQTHVLTIELVFGLSRDEVQVGALPGGDSGIRLATRVPIMNRER